MGSWLGPYGNAGRGLGWGFRRVRRCGRLALVVARFPERSRALGARRITLRLPGLHPDPEPSARRRVRAAALHHAAHRDPGRRRNPHASARGAPPRHAHCRHGRGRAGPRQLRGPLHQPSATMSPASTLCPSTWTRMESGGGSAGPSPLALWILGSLAFGGCVAGLASAVARSEASAGQASGPVGIAAAN